MKLGLGSAQFGLDYGVSNTTGKVPIDTVARILEAAAGLGCKAIDTARAYGDSESVLGECLWKGHPFKITTKTAPITGGPMTANAIRQVTDDFRRSLDALRQPDVDGLMVHHAANVTGNGGADLVEALFRLKEEGLVRKVGVSIYTSADVAAVLGVFRPDILQAPVSVLDQRLIRDGTLARLRDMGVEIHARSVYLQGLLLMNLEMLPPPLGEFRPALAKVANAAGRLGVTRAELALAFVCARPEIDVAVVGVTNEAELRDAARACEVRLPSEGLEELFAEDERLLNPAQWPALS
jgi:aryl-alcohol dehydrogenase-like predicted oxidoreductase